MKRTLFSLAGFAVLAVPALAQFAESEPNDSKAAANVFSGLTSGATIRGNSIGSTGTNLDYFRLSTAAAGLGIYRHRLTITTTGTAGHTGTIRGLNQIAAAAGVWDGSSVGTAGTTDNTAQSSSSATTPARFNQWYGFGKMEEIYYRVTGTSTTTADYLATYTMDPVTPVDLGTFQPGTISISTFNQGHTTDTDLWVYDSNLNAILGYGNDDESVNGGSPGTGGTLQSFLRRTYGVGRYYIALTNFNLANSMGSPNDDDFRTGTMLDFPNAVVNSSTSTNLNMTFSMTDSSGTRQFAATKLGPYDIHWATFNVVPEPATMTALGLGALALLRRRRK